jgi:hypothetical protein
MPQRECLDCRTLTTNGSRCPTCTAARSRVRDQQRGTTTQRGLGWDHQKAAALILDGAEVCGRCGQPGTDTDPLEAGHRTARANGGTNDLSNYRPEHRSCNRAAGSR